MAKDTEAELAAKTGTPTAQQTAAAKAAQAATAGNVTNEKLKKAVGSDQLDAVKLLGAVMAEANRIALDRSKEIDKTPDMDKAVNGGHFIVDGRHVNAMGQEIEVTDDDIPKPLDHEGNVVEKGSNVAPVTVSEHRGKEASGRQGIALRPTKDGGLIDPNGVLVDQGGSWVDATGKRSAVPVRAM